MTIGWSRVGEEEVVHDGRLRVVRRHLREPDGRVSDWELLDGPDSVTVLALTADERVVCIRQYRPGPDRVVLSLPGGLLDPSETPVEAAARELHEETGWTSSELTYAGGAQWVKTTEVSHAVVARACSPAGAQRLTEHEHIEVVVLTLADVRRELRSGGFGTVEQTYIALDHAGLLR